MESGSVPARLELKITSRIVQVQTKPQRRRRLGGGRRERVRPSADGGRRQLCPRTGVQSNGSMRCVAKQGSGRGGRAEPPPPRVVLRSASRDPRRRGLPGNDT